MENSKYDFKTRNESWNEGRAKNITFIITEDCQFACRYCYLTGKNRNGRMSFDIAKKTIDYLISDNDFFREDSVIFEFIGGEPLLEIDLMDKIADYIKIKLFETSHRWFHNYRFSFATNGLLYSNKKVQKFIEKNLNHLSIGISIDGTKRKHNMQRVYPDGRGTYDDIIGKIPLWIKQFPNAATKITVSSEDLSYVKESLLHMYDIGIKNVDINVVFENVWKDDDDKILENQLLELADYLIDNNIYKDFVCSLFSEHIGKKSLEDNNWCGTGRMMAVDYRGNFYPCVRFTPFSLKNKEAVVIGNCFTGINVNKLRPFLTLNKSSQSPEECLDCDIDMGCAWCQGFNYDDAESNTIFKRATYICKMHKARVRANNYYWNKIDNKLGRKV
ncbi:MAG TPA: radical SAM peptide maturase, CXXX-repeat target family [Ignavibacteria bacterium]